MSPSHDTPLLSVEGLRIAAGQVEVVQDVSFAIAPGEILALVGESGSGKTATGRAAIGLLPPGLRASGGAIRLRGEDLLAARPDRLRALRGAEIGMVFQEPMVSLNPAMTIGAQMAEGLALHRKMSAAEIRAASLAMLRRVQIRNPESCLSAFPHEFSGGMRQRIMLASVMLLRPSLLIADEPTTALDTLAQREILDLMVELARDHGTSVLLITHNLGLVARYAHRAVVLQRGRVVEQGPAASLLGAPQHAYTRALVEALPRRTPRPPRAVDTAQPVLEARGLEVTYPGRRRFFRRQPAVAAVRGIDLAIYPGETVALVGGSGSGKTTLGRAMLRLVQPTAGQLLFRGEDVTQARGDPLRRFRLACQIVFQDPYSSLDPRMRIGEIVAEPLRHLPDLDAGARRRRTEQVFEEVGLPGLAHRFPHELSGGQRQRVAIARAIIRNPALVVADEPVSALDMSVQKQILALFRRLQQEHGFACLFVSHDLAAVEEVSDRVLVMQQGVLVEQGPRDRIFDHPEHPYTRDLLAAAPRLDALPQRILA
ncbi:ABC transporter ATP-binding protein [Pseudoroseomonas cervicalis]|uniref:Putative phosphonate C-P lyase system protein PhnK n=1 Tax=Pseudoroseomonas cervicalis ATCC 49957 TaxID=525371 RepID=D5RJH9_9PROT|nr:ABC transporter ATP-binding protein [Pseudoroseomonas cervicalis]EFH12545.1 putative phosphonate C-P lyase system protein PhnK [Pseudoroseomonas cervicalis ATCC 49957]